jgi:hypothetical protein
MAERIDRPSDIEFAKAIVQNIPESDKSILKSLGAAYVASEVIRSATKKR